MSDPVTAAEGDRGRGPRPARALRFGPPGAGELNGAVVRGGVGVAVGLAALVLITVSTAALPVVLACGLGALGVHDVADVLARRAATGGRGVARLLRGLVGVALAVLLLVTPPTALGSLLALVGVLLVLRGLVTLAAGVLGRRERRAARLVGGVSGAAVGVVAVVTPASLAEAVLLIGALLLVGVGAVVLGHGIRAARAGSDVRAMSGTLISDLVWDQIRDADIGEDSRAAIADTLYFEAPERRGKLAAWWTMLLLSIAIATFAVLQDSTAVVIGAMLVAPLMVPILGLAGSLVNGWTRRATASGLLVLAGACAAVAFSLVLSTWLPAAVAFAFDSNTQVLGRVSPNLLDLLIAVAAGAAGAFATVNARVASGIAGVSIAVALVPPLAVVGIAIGAAEFGDALGAFLLFLTNFVAIVLSAAAVFVLTGFARTHADRAQRRRLTAAVAPFAALALVVLVPLVVTSQGLLVTFTTERTAHDTVEDWLRTRPGLRLVDLGYRDGVVEIGVTGTGPLGDVADLQRRISAGVGYGIPVAVEFTPSTRVQIDPTSGAGT
ncbi:DUF389 domain-containing protein [Pseudonocardia petroleophila]|uniref:DUF389 domain-containing protein n=1 Tax=Pseudonocardia petroleophila TaxID=37331 RepID=A0A7G7MJM7_9PSEU|nr:DUF389 domain-containing protein [Pseudonocardia petroleophila]QNG52988.1 DUF389 domain-containing protein [Pseudonocardia petroleophila]